MAIPNTGNQFLEQSKGNQFAMTSFGGQTPSGSFDLGFAMPLTPNPTTPMTQSHIPTESTEGGFVPTYRNVDEGIVYASNQEVRTQPFTLPRTIR